MDKLELVKQFLNKYTEKYNIESLNDTMLDNLCILATLYNKVTAEFALKLNAYTTEIKKQEDNLELYLVNSIEEIWWYKKISEYIKNIIDFIIKNKFDTLGSVNTKYFNNSLTIQSIGKLITETQIINYIYNSNLVKKIDDTAKTNVNNAIRKAFILACESC